jgi:hypothetical protein
MNGRPLLVAVLLVLSGVLPLVGPAEAQPSTVRTTLPPKFGADVGPAYWSFSASKLSWASADGSNITLSLPSLTAVVTGTSCAIAQTSTFSHTTGPSGVYKWTYSGASACHGVALATSMILTIQNLTAYNQKEILATGSIAKAGSSTVTPEVLFPLTFLGKLGVCDTGSVCSSVQAGETEISWANLGTGDTFLYSNSTKTLTTLAASSSATTVTFSFDPIALDGSAESATTVTLTCNGSNTMSVTLTTVSSPDVIVVYVSSVIGTRAMVYHGTVADGSSLSWTKRANVTNPNGHAGTEEFYAIASGALTNDVITYTLGACAGASNIVALMVAFGVSGANTGSPFDTGSSFPLSASSNSAATGTTTITTANANDLVSTTWVSGSGHTPITAPAGYSNIANAPSCGSTCNGWDYKVYSSTQSGVAVTWSWTGNGGFVIVTDAIVNAGTITQPIILTTANSGPSGTFTLSGCGVSPGTIASDGASHSFTATASCSNIVVAIPADGANTRYRFASDAIQWLFSTCAGPGTCSTQSNTVYYQLKNTYEATPQTPSTWDGIYVVTVTGTYEGTGGHSGCTVNTAAGGGAVSCSAWFDYNLPVGPNTPIGNTWVGLAPTTFTDTTGGNTDNVPYVQSTGGGPDYGLYLGMGILMGGALLFVAAMSRRKKRR